MQTSETAQQKPCNVFTVLKEASDFLTSHDITEAKIDAEVLLCGVLNLSRKILPTLRKETVPQQKYDLYKKYLNERITGKPISYILQSTEFMGLNFKVTPDVLIPRSETEILVENAGELIKKNKFKKVLDLCTGSGCIAVSLAYYNDNLSVTASDISSAALITAKENAVKNKVADKINFIQSNMFDNIIKEKFDIIISNPPYVTAEEYKTLQKEIFFEPKNALVADDNGLYFYKEIARTSKRYLADNGFLLLELNSNLSSQIAELFKNFSFVKIVKDYSQLDRILVIKNG